MHRNLWIERVNDFLKEEESIGFLLRYLDFFCDFTLKGEI
jgi:hypothetical protein